VASESRSARRVRTAAKAFQRTVEGLLAMAMTVMLVAGVTQVVARYLLELSLVWPEETARYMMTGGTFLAIPVLTLSRGQIAVDAVMHYIRSEATRALAHRAVLLVELLVIGFLTNLAWTNAVDAHSSGQSSAGMGIPLAWPLGVVALGCALGALATLCLLVLSFLEPRERWVPLSGPPEGSDVHHHQGVNA
jgi:TRAP-type C4-dicarboxylate transport system permease small subunit